MSPAYMGSLGITGFQSLQDLTGLPRLNAAPANVAFVHSGMNLG